jgi:hypothetical protein
MAIAPETRPTLSQAHERVRSPLHRLRGTIRMYIALEGLILLATYLALWFWIGLVLDYGFFKLFALDWVQVLPWWFRAGVLAALLAGLALALTFRVALRLARDFRERALALVLERRFPKLLGDRLITAVELADPREAARNGYSQAMLEQTIHEAAVQVDKLPLGEVFDWMRLVRGAVRVAVLTVGLYAVAVGVFGFEWLDGGSGWSTGGPARLRDTGSLWFERNVLLRNVIWPRRAHLELIDFPREGKTIGRGTGSPTLRVRALKWVIADDTTDEGWRALRVADLGRVLGQDLVEGTVPPDWQPRDPEAGLTMDEVELRLDKPDIHAGMADARLSVLRETLERLDEKAADPAVRGKFRKLTIPATVYVNYRGATSKSEMTLQRTGDNEFSGQFSALTESIRFTARGEDYYTAARTITVVPPPILMKLDYDLFRPAYLSYRVPRGSKPADLVGQKQVERGLGVSLFGGDKSTLSVPAGSDVELTGRVDKELREAPTIRRNGQGTAPGASPVRLLDPHTFTVRFDNVRSPLELQIELIDTDDVTSLRQVEILPLPDKVPEVNVVVSVIRRTPQGFLVTPVALIPFDGKVEDDYGLDDVQFAYSLTKLDRQADQNARGIQILSAALQLPGGPGHELFTASAVAAVTRDAKPAGEEAEAAVQRRPLEGFAVELVKQRREFLDLATIKENLARSQSPPKLTKVFQVKPDEELHGFDLQKLPTSLKVDPLSRDAQPRYKMQLWMEAVDNNLETGPGRSQVKERLPFLVVSEEELLSEIGKEEEGLYNELNDVVAKLNEGLAKLDKVKTDLIAVDLKAQAFGPMSVRAEEQSQILDKQVLVLAKVLEDYERILKELKTNRVQPEMINRVETTIVKELAAIKDVDFPTAAKAMADFQAVLDGNDPDLKHKSSQAQVGYELARDKVVALKARLEKVLASMQKLLDIAKLIKILVAMEQEKVRQHQIIQKLRDDKEKEIVEGLEGIVPDQKDPKKPDK